MSVSSNSENKEFVEPKLLQSVSSETDNVKSIPEDDGLIKSNPVSEEMYSDKCHKVKNNIKDDTELGGTPDNLSVKMVKNDSGQCEGTTKEKDKLLKVVTCKIQKKLVIKQEANEENHTQNGLENMVTVEQCKTDFANNVTASTSTNSTDAISKDIKSEDKQQPTVNGNEPGKVVLQSKSSASLSNLLVYNSNDESSDDSSYEEGTNKQPFSPKNVYRIDSSSSSSVSSGEFMYDTDGDYSSSEEIRYVFLLFIVFCASSVTKSIIIQPSIFFVRNLNIKVIVY